MEAHRELFLAFEHDEYEGEDDDPPSGYTVEATYSEEHEARWTRKGKVYCYGYKGHLMLSAMAFNLKKAALMMGS